jgi:hypothetical protein
MMHDAKGLLDPSANAAPAPIVMRLTLAILIGLATIVCCLSLIIVAKYQPEIGYDGNRLAYAVASAAAFSLVSLLFVFARFSFGYLIGFYCYILILGFLWLSSFSRFHYDQKLAALSAATSGLFFLLPALAINAPVKQVFALRIRHLEWLLAAIMLLSLGTIAVAASYNFRFATLGQIYDFRDSLSFPGIVRYLLGAIGSVLLPFAFACYVTLGHRWRAAAALVLMVLFYPVTLTKFALFAPVWIIVVLIVSRFFESRVAVILLALLPVLLGAVLMSLFPNKYVLVLFNMINIRMYATISGALDVYNDFFASHPLTHFCQVSVLKPFMSCPYEEPLSIVMDKAYGLGNLNASLFATEGVASVGLYLAPLTALAAGLVIAIGNRASADLPPRFVLISSALCSQVLVNVPLTTALLTHGIALLFLLWYLVPREMFPELGTGTGPHA